jgi:hypothetical protein
MNSFNIGWRLHKPSLLDAAAIAPRNFVLCDSAK